MTSPKLAGLAYLCEEFDELTVPTRFVPTLAVLDDLDLADVEGTLFRVRTGRTSGSEMEAPYASLATAAEAEHFLREQMTADSAVVGVVHQVEASYFDALVVGSLLVSNDGSLYIELQTISQAAVADLHTGTGSRPRDWAVDAVLLVGPGQPLPEVPRRHLALVEDLEALVQIGRRVHVSRPEADCVVRFNLYADQVLVLDDFRLVDAFGGER